MKLKLRLVKTDGMSLVDHSKLRSNLRRSFKFGVEIIKFLSTMLVNMRAMELGCALCSFIWPFDY